MKKYLIILAFLLLAIQPAMAVTANAGPDRTVQVGQNVTFDASGSTGTIVSYYWSFGDGANATGIRVVHSYSAPGTYTVTLIVVGNDGTVDSDTATVTVLSDTTPPTITHTPITTATKNKSITITATITDPSGIYDAKLYFKNDSMSSYAVLTMAASGDTYSATINSIYTNSNHIYYYLEARDNSTNHNLARLPATGYYTVNLTTTDTTPPVVTLVDVNGYTAPPFYLNTGKVTVNVSVNEPVTWCRIGAGSPQTAQYGTNMRSIGTNMYSYTLTLSDGSYTYYVVCNDTSGNKNIQTNVFSVNFTVDTHSPTGSLSVSTLSNGASISYTYSDPNIATVALKRDGNILISFSTNNNGSGTWVDTNVQAGQSYTYQLVITDKAGNIATMTKSWTAPMPTPTITPTAIPTTTVVRISTGFAGGGGGGGAIPAETKYMQVIPETVKPNEVVVIAPTADISEVTGLLKVEIRANQPATVTFKIAKVSKLPSGVPAPQNAYSIFEIKPSVEIYGEHDVYFRVAKSWLRSHNFNPEDVVLTKFVDGKWKDLDTKMQSQDENYYYYKAKINAFSLFAIVVKSEAPKTVTTTTTFTTVTTVPTVAKTTAATTTTVQEKRGIPGFELVIALLALLYVAYRMRR